MMRVLVALLVLFALACNGSGEGTVESTEVCRTRAGDIDVVLLADQRALNQGKSTFTIEFRRASDGEQLVDVGVVKATATMPMAGMAPMMGGLTVEETETPGRYSATSDLDMAGEWRLELRWSGPSGAGRAVMSPTVQ